MGKMIPDELYNLSKQLDCNVINYITTAEGGDIFAIGKVDEEGNPMTTGLPRLFEVRGSYIRQLEPEDAMNILSKRKTE